MNITGNSGNNFLQGTTSADLILGQGGNDTILGQGGQDSLYGGMGFDSISFGQPGVTTYASAIIYGGFGNDTIQYSSIGSNTQNFGNNTIYGGTGVDSDIDGRNVINLQMDFGSDLVYAGSAGDSITLGQGGLNTLIGGVGNDTIQTYGTSGSTINGNGGNDSINVGFVSFFTNISSTGDTVHGGMGNDSIAVNGNSGGNIVAADLGNDLVNDFSVGGNFLYGGQGNDSITVSTVGTTGDVVTAGLGSDTISVVGAGANTVYGGTDSIGAVSDAGNFIFGGLSTGTGLFVGGGGADSIQASVQTGAAAVGTTPQTASGAVDTLTGGTGNDTFSFGVATTALDRGYAQGLQATTTNVDSITDFVIGSDKIQLTGRTVGAVVDAGNQNASSLVAAAQAADGGTEGTAYSFSYQGSSYVLVSDGTAAFNSGDYLIGINNRVGLTGNDFINIA